MKPIQDRVLIKRDAIETESEGGIALPEAYLDKENTGTVVAAGDGKFDDLGVKHPLTVKVGDRVVFGPNVGTELTVGGEKVLLMLEGDIFGILESGE